ncbi:MAG: metallopeptidase family protein [Actinomycetota bacterium]
MDAGREYFESLVADALDELPEEFASRMENVVVVVEEEPEGPLLGLYHGIPQTGRGSGYFGVLPDVITIYRGPIERHARGDLRAAVRKTVWHEIAHHFGVSDEWLTEHGWG